MKSTTLGILAVLIIVIVGGYVFLGSAKNNGNSITGNAVSDNVNNGEVQKVVLSMRDFNYYPPEVKVKAGQPVSLSIDDKVYGCLKAVTIRELGLSKYLKTSSETLDFTPTKAGKYTIACSMGMGYGKLVVE